VDYPLRTTALMAVFAWASAMVVAPIGIHVPSVEEGTEGRRRGERRSRSRTPNADAGEAATSTDSDPAHAAQAETPRFVPAPQREDWPDAWQPAKRPPSTEH
jgi:hypothetical protein